MRSHPCLVLYHFSFFNISVVVFHVITFGVVTFGLRVFLVIRDDRLAKNRALSPESRIPFANCLGLCAKKTSWTTKGGKEPDLMNELNFKCSQKQYILNNSGKNPTGFQNLSGLGTVYPYFLIRYVINYLEQ